MKKYVLSIVVVLLLAFNANAQISNFLARDVGGTYIVDVQYDIDSAATLGAWNTTGFYPYGYDGVDFSSTPVSVIYENTDDSGGSAGDTCIVSATLYAIVTSTQTDVPVDTLFTSDSTNAAASTTLDFNNKRATGYWLELTNTGQNASGWIQLVFAKKENE